MMSRTRIHPRAVLGGVALLVMLGAAGGLQIAGAPVAGATDANVSYSQTCTTATVTVRSTWDGPSHIHIDAVKEYDGTVPPHGVINVRFDFSGAPTLRVVVSSSNTHLHGDLDHTFVRPGDCETPNTTVPPTPVTTCDEAIPIRDDCGTNGNPAAATPTTAPPTTAPVAATTVASAVTPVTADVTSQRSVNRPVVSLPATGTSLWENPILWAGAAALLIGGLLVFARRSDNRKQARARTAARATWPKAMQVGHRDD